MTAEAFDLDRMRRLRELLRERMAVLPPDSPEHQEKLDNAIATGLLPEIPPEPVTVRFFARSDARRDEIDREIEALLAPLSEDERPRYFDLAMREVQEQLNQAIRPS